MPGVMPEENLRDCGGAKLLIYWCRQRDLNPQPPDYKSGALPIELCRRSRRLDKDKTSEVWGMTGVYVIGLGRFSLSVATRIARCERQG